MHINGLHHIGVYTVDRDRSIHFYENMLGFVTTWSDDVPLPAGIFKAAMLRQGSCVIELVQPPDASRVGTVHGPVQHIALEVDDIKEVVVALKAKGAVFESEEITAMPEFTQCGVWHIFIKGPSGERIELVENMPRKSM